MNEPAAEASSAPLRLCASPTGSVPPDRHPPEPEISIRNGILAALPDETREHVCGYLERVPLRRRQVLYERNVPIHHAYFIEVGSASLLSRASGSRDSLEVASLGRQDFVGLPILLGTGRSPHRCIVGTPGEALRIRASDLPMAMREAAALQQLLFGYVQAAMVQSAQLMLCNARHSLRQRLARCLLACHDSAEGDSVAVTHQGLSRALGVRRAGITTSMGDLEAGGLVRRGRGEVTVLDRAGLEAASCDCYRVIRAERQRIFNGELLRSRADCRTPQRAPFGLSPEAGKHGDCDSAGHLRRGEMLSAA